MKRKNIAGLVIAVALLTSCATFTQPQTKSEKIAYLNGLITSFETTAKKLFDTGKINISTAKAIQTNIHTAAQELDLAQNATNDTATITYIQSAAVLLNSINTQLQEVQSK